MKKIAHKQKIQQEIFAKITKKLTSSLDQQVTVGEIVKLIVPKMADDCRIAIVDSHNSIKETTVKGLYKRYKDLNESAYGIAHILKTGKAEIQEKVDTKTLKTWRSYMGVPFIARHRVIGAMTFASSKKGRYFTPSDLRFAQEIAYYIGLTLDNTQLYKESQDAIKLRDEFILAVSHELKTPLTTMRIFTQLLAKKFQKEKGPLTRYIKKIDNQVDRLTYLIYDLLDISKIQTGKLDFHMKQFDIVDLVEETVSNMQYSTGQHKIIVKDRTPTSIYADRDRLAQVLINLIDNAVKYSPSSTKVLISLKKQPGQITIMIQDFGIGIDKKNQAKIFERFYQVNEPGAPAFSGLGMGLYISAEIVRRHSGVITVKSQKGGGSVFSFSLPLTKKTD